MARHNYLIQRLTGGGNTGNPSSGEATNWNDTGPFGGNHTRDSFGNMGHRTRKEARRIIKEARKAFPNNTYRIIQIVS